MTNDAYHLFIFATGSLFFFSFGAQHKFLPRTFGAFSFNQLYLHLFALLVVYFKYWHMLTLKKKSPLRRDLAQWGLKVTDNYQGVKTSATKFCVAK